MKRRYDWLDVVAFLIFAMFLLAMGRDIFAQQKSTTPAPTTPAISEATKIKLLLAQHDFEQTQVRYAQAQQQWQQQQAQMTAEAGKEFSALEALKDAAYTEAHADKAAWTLTDKMEFVAVPKRPEAPAPPAAVKP